MYLEEGIKLRLWIGPNKPTPVSTEIAEGLQRARVNHSDERRSGFQLTFTLESSSNLPGGIGTSAWKQKLKVPNQIHLSLMMKATPHTLINGVITNRQVQPGNQPGSIQITVTGEDQSWFLAQNEMSTDHKSQKDATIVRKVIQQYAKKGLSPDVTDPKNDPTPNPVDAAPTQQNSDFGYLTTLAQKHGHVFYINPKSAPNNSTAYWGPPIRSGSLQSPLNVNLGSETNVEDINFTEDQTRAMQYEGYIQDRNTNQQMSVPPMPSTRIPLSSQPSWQQMGQNMQTKQLRLSGVTLSEAMARSRSRTNQSMDDVVRARGSLQPVRYGGILKPRTLVPVRGIGSGFDGTYYVKNVSHRIEVGSYTQNFVITREGTGAIESVLPV